MTHHTHDHEEEDEAVEAVAPVHHHRHHHGFFKRLLIAVIINTGAVLAVLYFVKGISFAPDIDTFRLQLRTVLITGILIGLANGIIKPILKFFTFPLIILTLGLLLLGINMFVFWLVIHNIKGLVVTGGFAAYFWGSIIFSLVNTIEHWLLRPARTS